MEPPPKRPRLSMFRDLNDSDATLAVARQKNDRRLKSRWESIFNKYGRDFSNIADEIDNETGEILVNNGHLASIRDEKDTGQLRPTRASSFNLDGSEAERYDGGRLLRAMTAAPGDYDVPYPSVEDDDDVLVLFERIAQNAAQKTSFSDVYIKPEESSEAEDDGQRDGFQHTDEDESDRDSLLGTSQFVYRPESPSDIAASTLHRRGSGSPDSLLDEMRDVTGMTRSPTADSLLDEETWKDEQGYALPEVTRELSDQSNPFDEDAILRRYGPDIGPHILEAFRQRNAMEEEKIEPAWRLPETGPSFETFSDARIEQNVEQDRDDNDSIDQRRSPTAILDGHSIWTPAMASRRRSKPVPPPPRPGPQQRASSLASDESEDPLQEGFKDKRSQEEAQAFAREWQDCMEQSICPYCKQYKSRLMDHFRVMVNGNADGIHDIEYLRDVCKSRPLGLNEIRHFLDVVRYRELDDLGFKEIASKTGSSFRLAYNTYYQYRITQKPEEKLAAEGRAWSHEEDDLLRQVMSDSNATFRSAKALVSRRRYGEIGNRLATLHMRTFEEQGLPIHQAQRRALKEKTEPLENRIKSEPRVVNNENPENGSTDHDDTTAVAPWSDSDHDSLLDGVL